MRLLEIVQVVVIAMAWAAVLVTVSSAVAFVALATLRAAFPGRLTVASIKSAVRRLFARGPVAEQPSKVTCLACGFVHWTPPKPRCASCRSDRLAS